MNNNAVPILTSCEICLRFRDRIERHPTGNGMLKSIRDDRYIIICFDQELPHDNADRVISHTVDRVAEACRILSLEVDRAECLPQMTDHRGKAIENHRMNKVQIFFKPA